MFISTVPSILSVRSSCPSSEYETFHVLVRCDCKNKIDFPLSPFLGGKIVEFAMEEASLIVSGAVNAN